MSLFQPASPVLATLCKCRRRFVRWWKTVHGRRFRHSEGFRGRQRRWFAMIGEKLGHYRLTAKIGEGGMGVVYRARDEELNRDVAVKVLAAGMLGHLGKDHLLKEAQTASALNHPNIITVYDISSADGQTIVQAFQNLSPPVTLTTPGDVAGAFAGLQAAMTFGS